MARIDIAVAWLAGERARAAPLLLQLLRAIRDLGSIQRASAALGISYRNSWGLLESWSAELARPLIDKTRGRGTRLTDLGELLLRCDDEVRAALDPQCARLRQRLDRQLGLAPDGPGRLTISASHDLALAAVRDALNDAGGLQLDVQFRGSIDSIDAMLAERCELAGFHVDSRGGADLAAPYRQRLNAHRHAIVVWKRQHRCLFDRRMPIQCSLDFPQLDAVPTLFNHAVAPAKELIVSVGELANDIAGTIPSFLVSWQKCLRRVFRQIPVSLQDAWARDTQLSFGTLGNLDTKLIDHEWLAVGTGFADGNGFALRSRDNSPHFIKRADIGFRWSVKIEILWMRPQ